MHMSGQKFKLIKDCIIMNRFSLKAAIFTGGSGIAKEVATRLVKESAIDETKHVD